MQSIEELQTKLSQIHLYVALPPPKLKEAIELILEKIKSLGFFVSRRAEGYALFPFQEAIDAGLPDLRLTIMPQAIIISIHFATDLTEENAAKIGKSPQEIYDLLLNAVNHCVNVLSKYKKHALIFEVKTPQ